MTEACQNACLFFHSGWILNRHLQRVFFLCNMKTTKVAFSKVKYFIFSWRHRWTAMDKNKLCCIKHTQSLRWKCCGLVNVFLSQFKFQMQPKHPNTTEMATWRQIERHICTPPHVWGEKLHGGEVASRVPYLVSEQKNHIYWQQFWYCQ